MMSEKENFFEQTRLIFARRLLTSVRDDYIICRSLNKLNGG